MLYILLFKANYRYDKLHTKLYTYSTVFLKNSNNSPVQDCI